MNQPLKIAYIFERYPVLSQTFLRREIAALRQQGLNIEIHAMFKQDDGNIVPELEGVRVDYFRKWEILKLIFILPSEFFKNPIVFREGWRRWRQTKFKYSENFWSSVWAIIFALCRARQFRRDKPDMVHGVRATGAATAAAILSRLCRVPYSFGAHAYDIYRHGGDALLNQKLLTASFVHTTTETAVKYLRECAGGTPANIILSRRGLLQLPPLTERKREDKVLRLLSVGRLVSKKGHEHQIAACVILQGWSIPFELRIVGDGPLRARLQTQIGHAGLQNFIKLVGALTSEQIEEQYRWADIFLHTGVVDGAGDRDGIPNVIPEAMAHGLPIICTDLPELLEVVSHQVNGMVVDIADEFGLVNAITRLAEHPELIRQLGENGRRWVEENFLASKNTQILADAFKQSVNLK